MRRAGEFLVAGQVFERVANVVTADNRCAGHRVFRPPVGKNRLENLHVPLVSNVTRNMARIAGEGKRSDFLALPG